MPQGFMIFHLNLAFSSIRTELQPQVIRQCYWPLLHLVERKGLPLGLELTGWTLAQIAELDPAWIQTFARLLREGRCELIGSGWTQMIGPLAPYEANRWNQRLGREAYQHHLGVTPDIVLVNEMAYSTGMVDVYAEAGYRGLVMDRDNVRLALGLDHAPISATPTHAQGCGDTALPVVWGDSILFQSLQRVVHGDKAADDYIAYVRRRAERDGAVLPIYCNDAEIFDFRPGRFRTEATLSGDSEWARLERLCERLESEVGLQWLRPTAVMTAIEQRPHHRAAILSSIAHPIPVKKQAKYNINRWSVTGRDDLALNSDCHRLSAAFTAAGNENPDDWRALCELWASDLRTHITDERWQQAQDKRVALLQRMGRPAPVDVPPPLQWQVLDGYTPPSPFHLSRDASGISLTLRSPHQELTLNLRRGLTISSLAFASWGWRQVVGTLSQGYFDSIALGADFYSGGVLLESPVNRERQADLEWVEPEFAETADQLWLRVRLPFAEGTLEKRIALDLRGERVTLAYLFEGIARPQGTLRVGILTLQHEQLQEPILLRCKQGGPEVETFTIDGPAMHGMAASTLVSSSAGFGATNGNITLEDAQGLQLNLRWNPSQCAAIPMLTHQPASPHPFTRLKFSLAELDDTTKGGGSLRDFVLQVTPA
ncbi:MAG: glycoside hydrolase family 57 [Roseateles depolymerans]|uniref:Glycoside hydrolase family 57 n=1 Tax=Roseateles depolymerans TaxID=76731 RepID=A0A2W5D4Q9_9BURK|nr:MAG: glycoside hydrolase family 57 [Roseateles depolymerans]